MNKLKAISIFVLFALVASIPGAMAYDADTPYTVTMNFIVPSDTTFSVDLALSETTIDFNPATKNSTEVEPDSQDDAGTVPIAVVTNDGNVNLNFTINLTATKPSWVDVKYSDANTYAGATSFDDSPLGDANWNDIIPTGTIDIYLWADFTNAAGGTTQRTFQINTVESV